MRKFVITIIVLNSIIWFGLSSLAKAEDNDYGKAVVGSVIQSTINGDKAVSYTHLTLPTNREV